MRGEQSILVTGAGSGLGRQCLETFQGTAYTRGDDYQDLLALAKARPFDVIIHAAFNARPNIDSTQLPSYLNDTVLLTQKMLAIPHKKFIFISSIDVYPKNSEVHHEDEVIRLNEVSQLYAISKLMAESMVKTDGNAPLILRPSAMLGVYAKPNSLMKILTHDYPSLTLSAQSTFNYIRHQDVTDAIAFAMQHEVTGTFNLVASSSIQLSEVSRHFQKSVTFGDYLYQTAHADNQKIVNMLPQFKHTSMDNIKCHLKDLSIKEVEAS